MIVANITTFQGQCGDAEHFYCVYDKIELKNLKTSYYGSYHTELHRILKSPKEVKYLNIKDGGRWCVGMETIRFNSIKQIHNRLKELFPNEDIVTYYERDIFKDMLCILDGTDFGYKHFGETWNSLPSSCYKHLLSDDFKIKCYSCGKEHKLEDISYLSKYNDKDLVEFYSYYDIKKCCRDMELVWNNILKMEKNKIINWTKPVDQNPEISIDDFKKMLKEAEKGPFLTMTEFKKKWKLWRKNYKQ